MKNLLLFFLLFFHALHADEIVGFWKSIDPKTKEQDSIIAIYECGGCYYGRIILTYDPGGFFADTIYAPYKRAPGMVGEPYYCGLDIIWHLQKRGGKYVDGKILDPLHGKVYNVELWREGRNLVVRGKLLCFGRNHIWIPAEEGDFPPNFQIPNLSLLTPRICQTK